MVSSTENKCHIEEVKRTKLYLKNQHHYIDHHMGAIDPRKNSAMNGKIKLVDDHPAVIKNQQGKFESPLNIDDDIIIETIPFNHSNLSNQSFSIEPYLTITASLPQLSIAALCLVISVLFNLTILAVIHERVPRSQPPLPDVAFSLLPKIDHALDISEYIILFMVTSTLTMSLLHYYRTFILRRLFFIMSILYLLRAISMAVTQVPIANQQYYCSPQLNNTETIQWNRMIEIIISRVSHMSLGMGLSVNGRHSFCGDYIFSGHTVMMVTTFLFMNEYWLKNRKNIIYRLLKYVYFLLVCIGILCILISRGHYMVDIIIAYYIATRVFMIYHCVCDNVTQMEEIKSTKRLKTIWWYNLFSYIENDTIKHRIDVENRFDLPNWSQSKR